jgi:hypothetical protein
MGDRPSYCEPIVCVLPGGGIMLGDGLEEVMVWERPGGGAAPKMLEKAASR